MKYPTNIKDCHSLLDECFSIIEALKSEMDQKLSLVNEEITSLKSELKELKGKNSRNSHKPPSSDGLQKKPAFPRKKNKKQGGQKGHKGNTLKAVTDPDYQILLPLPSHCDGCGNALNGEIKVKSSRQIFDLPPQKLEVTEYVSREQSCSCGKNHVAFFPDHIKAPVQYGNSVRAFTTILNNEYNLSIHKIEQLFNDLYGYDLNASTIIVNNERCYQLLEDTETYIKEQIINSEVSHYDETGVRVAGKLHWMHVACTTLYTFLFVHPKRGREALDDAQIIENTPNWVVHDCWKPYFKYQNPNHVLCGAHLLRELTALDERGSGWADGLKQFLLLLYEMTDSGTGCLTYKEQKWANDLYDEICSEADLIEPQPIKEPNKRGRPKATKGRNLLDRFLKYKSAIIAFAFHKEVPFTNNIAERALRPVKTKQKVAGSLRTFKGAQTYARIRSFIDSTRKSNRNIFNELIRVFNGCSFLINQKIPT